MKKLINFTGAIMAVLLIANIAQAADTASISVSCTIPAIPGVNTPPYPEKELNKTKGAVIEERQVNQVKETETKNAFIVQVEDKTGLMAALDTNETVKTIYSR